MPDDTTYSLEQSLQALNALREAAGSPPEQFPLPAFVGMLSDEIETLRSQGKSDAEISTLIHQSSGIDITPQQLADNYAPPAQRRGPHR